MPHHLSEVRPGGAHAALGRDVLLEGLPRHQVLVRLVVDVVGVDVVRAQLVRVAVEEDDPRVVKRENVRGPSMWLYRLLARKLQQKIFMKVPEKECTVETFKMNQ